MNSKDISSALSTKNESNDMKNLVGNFSPNNKQQVSCSNFLIKKCSLFDVLNSKILLEDIKEVVEGFQQDSTKSDKCYSHQEQTVTNDDVEKSQNFESIKTLTVSDKLLCITCNFSFQDREEQKEHYKSDWHLFNLKQKIKGKSIVTADEFENLSDISSISGNESDEEKFYSSSSESSSSSEDETNTKSTHYAKIARNKPKISFRLNDNNILVVHRCILHGKRDVPENQNFLIDTIKSMKPNDKWSIILVAAGHFAAAIFKGDEVVVHKTFHRYVVRAKRGTVQSQHDSSGKHAKSAGANIRRYQEAAFKDDIRALLGNTWKSELDQCKCVFIRVPPYHRNVLISSNSASTVTSQSCASNTNTNIAPFSKNDTRIRHIPFMTFRPTFNEIKRTHNLLARLELYDSSYLSFISRFEKSPTEATLSKPAASKDTELKTNKSKSKSKTKQDDKKVEIDKKVEVEETADVVSDENLVDSEIEDQDDVDNSILNVSTSQSDFIQSLPSEELRLFNEIYTACSTNNVNKLQQLINNSELDSIKDDAKDTSFDKENRSIIIEKLLNKRMNKEKGYTLLHFVSELGHSELVWLLLLNGSDPALPDLSMKHSLPYNLATNKNTRDVFRRFMNDYPNRYDYKAARITSPLSAEKFNEKLEKEKEKRKINENLKNKEKPNKSVDKNNKNLNWKKEKDFYH